MPSLDELAGSMRICPLHLVEAEEDADYYEGLLSPEERQRAGRYRAARARRDFVLTRGFLRRRLGEYLDLDPRRVGFVTNDHGKPRLAESEENQGLVFSVSHSGDHAVLVFSRDRAIGVDVEQLRPRRGLVGLAQHCLSERERHVWSQSPESQALELFIRYWVCKEAFVKAVGRGIALGVSNVEVAADFTAFEAVPDGNGPPESWRLSEWGDADFRFALAYRGPELRLIS